MKLVLNRAHIFNNSLPQEVVSTVAAAGDTRHPGPKTSAGSSFL